MEGSRVCRVCRAILTFSDEDEATGACPYCGAVNDREPEPDNPYAPPQTSPADWLQGVEAGEAVPPTLLGKLAFAVRLFGGDFTLIVALVLTVWLPGNLLANIIVAQVGGPTEQRVLLSALLRALIGIFLGPISVASLIHVLDGRMTGNRLGYLQALKAGVSNWWPLFAARFVCGILIGLGFLALILPGIWLSIRYSLVDPAVVLEKAGVRRARTRSGEIVRGKEFDIFSGVTLMTFLYLMIVTAIQALFENRRLVEAIWVDTTLDCINDLFPVIGTCFLFTYFWEAHIRRLMAFGMKGAPNTPSGFDEDL